MRDLPDSVLATDPAAPAMAVAYVAAAIALLGCARDPQGLCRHGMVLRSERSIGST